MLIFGMIFGGRNRRRQWVTERQGGRMITREREQRPLWQHWEEERLRRREEWLRRPPSSVGLLAASVWAVTLVWLAKVLR